MARLSLRLKVSTAFVSVATALGPGQAISADCVFTNPRLVCSPGDYSSVQGAVDDLSIEFLPGATTVSPVDGAAVLNAYGAGLGTAQSVLLGESGVAFRPTGMKAPALVIDAFSPFKSVGAVLTGRIDVLSATEGGESPGVSVGASGDIFVDLSGRISTSGLLANALEVRSRNGDVTVLSSAETITSGNGSSGVVVERRDPNGPIRVDQNGLLYDVRTDPQLDDPDVSGWTFAPITRGSVDVRLAGPITVQGREYSTDPKQPSIPAHGVIVRNQSGDINLAVGDVTIGSPERGAPGVGILASALDGDLNINVEGSLNLHGALIGVYADARNGRVTINAPNPVFIDMDTTTLIRTDAGSFNITIGDATVTAFNPDEGMFSSHPRFISAVQRSQTLSSLSTGAIEMSTFNADAVLMYAKNADITFRSLAMSGHRAKGVFLSSAFLDEGETGRVSVNGPISQTGRESWGVYVQSRIHATVNSNITQTGADSVGVYGNGFGDAALTLRTTGRIESSGAGSFGIALDQFLYGDPAGSISLRSDGAIRMTGENATGAMLKAYVAPEDVDEYYFGQAPVTATFNGDVESTGAGGRAIEISGSAVMLDLNGATLGGTNSAQRAGAGVVARAGETLTITNRGFVSSLNLAAVAAVSETGSASLINRGVITGGVQIDGAGGALFRNEGAYWTAGLVTSAGGVVENSGFVGAVTAPGGTSDWALVADVANSGVISMRNGTAGDRLTVGDVGGDPRAYSASARATLEVDAALQAGGAADTLRLTGPASGTTRVAVGNMANGASTLTPTFIPIVTGAAGAPSTAFALEGERIASGLTDWTMEQRGDTFGLASTVSQARAGDAARAGQRAIDVFNLATPPDAGGVGGGGGAVNSAVMSYAPAQPRNAPRALAGFEANAGPARAVTEAARTVTPVAHLGFAHQRARTDGDGTSASAFYGGLDLVWGPLQGRAPRIIAGLFTGYSSGKSDMAGSSRAVTDVNAAGARVRLDVEGWFVGAVARGGVGDMKYTVPGARGSGDVTFSAFDAYAGRRFDIGANWYVQPTALTSHAKVRSNTIDMAGSPMKIDQSEWRYGGELRLGRDGMSIGASGWSMDAWVSGGLWREIGNGATRFGILAFAPGSNGAIWSYGGGLAVKAPSDALTMRLGAYGQAGGARSFTLFGGVSIPLGG